MEIQQNWVFKYPLTPYLMAVKGLPMLIDPHPRWQEMVSIKHSFDCTRMKTGRFMESQGRLPSWSSHAKATVWVQQQKTKIVFKWPIPGLFFFSSFQYNWQLTFNIIFCRWLDLNLRPLVSEVTALPTEPQPLPYLISFTITIITISNSSGSNLNVWLVVQVQ